MFNLHQKNFAANCLGYLSMRLAFESRKYYPTLCFLIKYMLYCEIKKGKDYIVQLLPNVITKCNGKTNFTVISHTYRSKFVGFRFCNTLRKCRIIIRRLSKNVL